MDQQDLVLGGFLFLSFGPLADSSLFSYCYGCGFHTLFYPLSFWDTKGEYVSFWTTNVFLNGQVIFVPKWPNGEFVNFWLVAFCLTKSLLCNVAVFTENAVDFSDIQSLFLWYGKSFIMTISSVTSWKKVISMFHEGFSVLGRFCANFKSENSDPLFPSGRRGIFVRTPISQ